MQKRTHTIMLLCSMAAAPCVGMAQPPEPGDASGTSYGGSLRAKTQITDNARKSETAPIDERQDEVSANLFGAWQGQWASFEADYTALLNHYDEGSQDARNTLEGAASLQLGRSQDLLDVLISHSRRSQYDSPDSVEINENLDERKIWSIVPTLKTALTRVDSIGLQGSYEAIGYRYNTLRDSERTGGNLYWHHRFSPSDSLRTSVGTTQVEYPNGNQDDFELMYVNLTYSAQLRSLQYSLMAGVNTATFSDGDKDYQAPTYRGVLSYANGPHQLSFNFSQEITDSSYGSGNQLGFDPLPGSDGVGIDQIERQSVGLDWQTTSLCSRCTFSAFVQSKSDNYRRRDEDNQETSAGLKMGYRLTERASVAASLSRRWQEFDAASRPNFYRDVAGLQYDYRFANHFSAGVFYDFESRQYEHNGGKYDENAVGISVSYTF